MSHNHQKVRMPFGRWRGVELSDLQDDYLLWLSDWPELKEPLKTHICEELRNRDLIRSNVELVKLDSTLVQSVRCDLARKYHPDIGGGDDVMRGINVAIDTILERLAE
jgi:hypothetical protein